MGRKAKKKANNLAALAVVIAAASFGVGTYLEYRLRPYRIFHAFTAQERGWRDQAFEIALYSALAALALVFIASLLRRV